MAVPADASLLLAAGCSPGSGHNARGPTSTTRASTYTSVEGSSGPSSTASEAPTSSSGTVEAAVNLTVSPLVRSDLLAAYVAYVHDTSAGSDQPLTSADVSGPVAGSVYYAVIPSTGIHWALASFEPTSAATEQQDVGFQDSGGSGLFEQKPGLGWVMIGHASGGGPWPCQGQLDPALMKVWSMPINQGCIVAMGGTIPSDDQPEWFSPPGYPNGQYFGIVWSVQQDYGGSGVISFEPETWTSPTIPPTRSHHVATLTVGPTVSTEYSSGPNPASSHVISGTWDLAFAQRVIADESAFSNQPFLGFVITVAAGSVTAIQEVGPLTPTGSADYVAPPV